MNLRGLVTAAAILLPAADAWAEVTRSEPGQAESSFDLHVSASAATAYAAVIQPARWWNGDHTWSGDPKNLTLEARAGGCWCEKLAQGGSVEHMHVVFAQPGAVLRLTGALGPLQSLPLSGVMTWSFKDDPKGGSTVALRYRFAGPLEAKDNWPPAVDAVLGQQVRRLQHYIDTGMP